MRLNEPLFDEKLIRMLDHPPAIKIESKPMADETPNHAQSIEGVLGTFEGELRKLSDRAAAIQSQTVKAFGDAHATFDHAEYINEKVGAATARLSRFLGPPPNEINMPKQIEIKADKVE